MKGLIMSYEQAQELNTQNTQNTVNPFEEITSDVSQNATPHHALSISSLILTAVLLAAGCILDLTVAKSLAITGIQPEFVIASFCLSILLLKPNIVQGIIIGALAATLIQLNTSIPGLEYACDIPASVCMTLMTLAYTHMFGHIRNSKLDLFPFILTFVTTLISGGIFATVATLVFLHLELGAALVMAPIVIGTAFANGLVVALLYQPLKLVLHK